VRHFGPISAINERTDSGSDGAAFIPLGIRIGYQLQQGSEALRAFLDSRDT
jgi:hypothetical protein